MFTRYRYLTLWHQDSLGDSSSEPFGVIVETKRYVYYIGFELTGDESSVTGQVLRNFHGVLKERIAAAAADARRTKCDALEVLRREFSWNVRASVLSSGWGRGSVERLGRKLFTEQVESWSPRGSHGNVDRFVGRTKFEFALPAFATG